MTHRSPRQIKAFGFSPGRARRVAVRMAYLGWTQDDLGRAIASNEGRDGPIGAACLRGALRGVKRYPWATWGPRIARALGVSEQELEPNTDDPEDFTVLAVSPVAHPDEN